jgi:hypothetical protein
VWRGGAGYYALATSTNNNSYCYKKSYSVYIKYYSKQGEKIMVLVRILLLATSS